MCLIKKREVPPKEATFEFDSIDDGESRSIENIPICQASSHP